VDEAIERFKCASLNPARGLADFTAGQIECIAESNLDGDVKIGKGRRQIHRASPTSSPPLGSG